MSFSIYVACPMDRVSVAHAWRDRLLAAGHTLSSRWHDVVRVGDRDPSRVFDRRAALVDNFDDVGKSDLLVAYVATGTPKCTWGEVAYAYAHGIPVAMMVPAPAGYMWDGKPMTDPLSGLAEAAVPVHPLALANTCILDAHPLCTTFTRDADLEAIVADVLKRAW